MSRYVAHNCDNNDTIAIARVATDGSATRQTVVDGSVNIQQPAGMSGDGFGMVAAISTSKEELFAYIQQDWNQSTQVKIVSLKQDSQRCRGCMAVNGDAIVVSWPRDSYQDINTAADALYVKPQMYRLPRNEVPDKAFDISMQVSVVLIA